jgi:lauroyl/myristoyl acyltransferase
MTKVGVRGRAEARQKSIVEAEAGQSSDVIIPSETYASPPLRAKLVRRHLKVAARPTFAWSDIQTVGKLMVWFVISWFLPEKRWPAASKWLAKTEGVANGSSLPVKINAITSNPKESTKALIIGMRATQIELYLQLLRSYRPGGWTPQLNTVGEEYLTTALREGRGAVLWVAHFSFNSLATKIAVHRMGKKCWHISRPEHGFSKTTFGIRWLNPIRASIEQQFLQGRIIINRENPAATREAALQALHRNELVSITAGAWEGNKIAELEFFGGTVDIAVGAPGLALTAGAPLIPVFTTRSEGKPIQVEFGEPVPLLSDGDRDTSIITAASIFLERSKPHVLQHLGQWRGLSSMKVDA